MADEEFGPVELGAPDKVPQGYRAYTGAASIRGGGGQAQRLERAQRPTEQPVTVAVEALLKTASNLETVVHEVEGRLGDVLFPELPRERGEAAEVPEAPGNSNLTQVLWKIVAELQVSTTHLARIRDRIEV